MRNKVLYIFLLLILLCSCEKSSMIEGPSYGPSQWVTAKVAVVLPLSGENGDRARYERICRMFEDNVLKAQYNVEQGVKLQFEWYDENTENIRKLSNKFYDRDDIKAVIGPLKDSNVEIMANVLSGSGIPMFVMTSSDDVVRRFSVGTAGVSVKKPFMWSLSETDIVQAQIILAKAGTMGVKNVSVISSANPYGNTFNKWVPYYALEMKFDKCDKSQYSSINDLKTKIEGICASDAEVLICALNDASEARVVLETVKSNPQSPKVYFTGSVFNSSLFESGALAEGAEGFSHYCAPYTGFYSAYQVRFGEIPLPIDAQLYDSFLLSFISFAYCHYSGKGMTMNEALASFSNLPLSADKEQFEDFFWEYGTPVWDYAGLRDVVMEQVRNGKMPEFNMIGASGNLKFAPDSYTSLVKSTYINWIIRDGRPVALDFIDERGVKYSSYVGAWDWKTLFDELENNTDSEYGSSIPDGNKAVLICGSEGWYNYRHQADLLYVYNTLKANDYTDDDIILIMRDDIAYHPKNPYKGVIRVSEDGENLYHDVVIDYRADTLDVKDIEDIMTGNGTERLSTVLESTDTDNVLLYWTGHGTNKSFSWLETRQKFTDVQMRETVGKMYENKMYQSMLIVAEPCYSGSVVKAIEGIPLVLGFSAADDNESSFADNYSNELGVWMCDRFTFNLMRIFAENPYIDLLNTYKLLNTSTLGSHVQVHNSDCFYYLKDCALWTYFECLKD